MVLKKAEYTDDEIPIYEEGPYLISADLNVKLLSSKCGYVSTRKAPSAEVRFNEIKSILNPADRKEVEDFYRSSEYRIRTERNQQILDDLYTKFSNGTDQKLLVECFGAYLLQALLKQKMIGNEQKIQ